MNEDSGQQERHEAEDASLAARVLALAGGNVDEARRLQLLRVFFMIHVGYELLLTSPWRVFASESVVFRLRGGLSAYLFAAAIALLLLLYRIRPEHRSWICRLATALGIGAIVWLFPGVPNHYFLVVFCLVVLALVDLDRPAEALLGLHALRWTAVAVLFFSGLQKVLYGSYFRAEFMTWAISKSDRFQSALGPFLPAGELARLHSLPPEGPFGTDWWPLILLSNAVWVFELTMPLLLLLPRTRGVATLATVVFLCFVEAGAREWLFGCVFVALLLLFPRRDYLRYAVPGFLVLYFFLLVRVIASSLGPWGGA